MREHGDNDKCEVIHVSYSFEVIRLVFKANSNNGKCEEIKIFGQETAEVQPELVSVLFTFKIFYV